MDKIAELKQRLFAKRAKQLKQAYSRDNEKQKKALRAKRDRLKTITDNCIKLRAERLARRREK
jgi:hypothetical protein